MDEKKNSPSANHRLLSHHVVQPLLVTKDVSPHKAGDVILINWDGTCCPDSDFGTNREIIDTFDL